MTLEEIIEAIGVKPYHRESNGALFHGDCLEVMRGIPDGAVDLVVTDPPYGISEKWVGGFSANHGWGRSHVEKTTRNAWDSAPPSVACFSEIGRVSRMQVVWGGNYFPLPPSRCWLVWNKPERGFTLAEAELAWTNADSLVRVYDGPRHEANRVHPTQKPLDLMKWCLAQSWAAASDIILDPFAGSGTTLVAAKQLGRRYIGIDIEDKYCAIAVDRLRQEELFG